MGVIAKKNAELFISIVFYLITTFFKKKKKKFCHSRDFLSFFFLKSSVTQETCHLSSFVWEHSHAVGYALLLPGFAH